MTSKTGDNIKKEKRGKWPKPYIGQVEKGVQRAFKSG